MSEPTPDPTPDSITDPPTQQKPLSIMPILCAFHACDAADEWAQDYTTAEEAYYACNRPDWLLWIAGRIGVDRNLLIRAACKCIGRVMHLVPYKEDRPRQAVHAAERWTYGEVGAWFVQEHSRHAEDAISEEEIAGRQASACVAQAAKAITYIVTHWDEDTNAADALAYVSDAASEEVAAKGGTGRQREAAHYAMRLACAEIVRRYIPYNVIEATWLAHPDAARILREYGDA